MKDDPFATLLGLDQQLYRDQKPKETTKQRDNETTLTRDSAGTGEPTQQPANQDALRRDSGSTLDRDGDQSLPLPNEPARQSASGLSRLHTVEATRTPAAALTGHHLDRLVERHSHDIFHDQVRWMNRLKLELEEQLSVKITSNGMVQVAVDLLRRDHEANGDDSNLMRALVFGKPLRIPGAKKPERGAVE